MNPSDAALKAIEKAHGEARSEQERAELAVALRGLGAPEERIYGVCVGGGCVTEEDSKIPDALTALFRAEALALDPANDGQPIQILLWGAGR